MRHQTLGLVLGLALIGSACQPAATITEPPPSLAAGTSAPASGVASAAATPVATLPVAVPRPTDLPTDGSCEDENVSCLGVLKANTVYRTKIFKPTVTFTMPVDGWINEYDGGGDAGLKSLDPAGDVIVFFRNPRSADASVGRGIQEIATWLEGSDELQVTPFEPAKLGGLSGLTLDLTSAPGAAGSVPGCPVQSCVALLRGDDPDLKDPYPWHWDWSNAGPERQRLYLLDAPGGTVAVFIDSIDGTSFDSLIAIWAQVAKKLQFG